MILRLFPKRKIRVPTVPSVPKQESPLFATFLMRFNLFQANRNIIQWIWTAEKAQKKRHPAKAESPAKPHKRSQVFPTSKCYNKKSSQTPRKIGKNPKTGCFWSCWADSNCRPHPYQELSARPKPDIMRFPALFDMPDLLNQQVVSAGSIR